MDFVRKDSYIIECVFKYLPGVLAQFINGLFSSNDAFDASTLGRWGTGAWGGGCWGAITEGRGVDN